MQVAEVAEVAGVPVAAAVVPAMEVTVVVVLLAAFVVSGMAMAMVVMMPVPVAAAAALVEGWVTGQAYPAQADLLSWVQQAIWESVGLWVVAVGEIEQAWVWGLAPQRVEAAALVGWWLVVW